jgi:hypothetical protein
MKIDPKEPCPCGSGKVYAECHASRAISQKQPAVSQVVKLQVIPEPDSNTRAVFVKTGEGTVIFQGFETGIAQSCGRCNAQLIVGLRLGQVQNIVLRCSACGSFNET